MDTPRKNILDECSVLFYLHDIPRGILSPGQLIIPALMLAIDLSFLLGLLKFNQSDKLSLRQKTNLSSIKGKLPQLWDGSVRLAPGIGH